MKTLYASTTILLLLLLSCKTPHSLISQTASSDILYIGVDNPLLLTGVGLKKLHLTIENGEIIPTDSFPNDTARFYIIKVNNPNPTVLKIKNGRSTLTYKYRNKLIPNPDIELITDSGRIKAGLNSISKMQTAKGLVAILSTFDYNCSIKILEYKLMSIKNNKTTESIFKSFITPSFQDINIGDIFIFHDVLIEFQDSKERRVVNGPTIVICNN